MSSSRIIKASYLLMSYIYTFIYIYIYIYWFPAQLTDCFRNFSLRLKPDTHGAKFPPLLHFIKKYKIPWILKWQYAKEDDVLARCWYVKWWDRFSHTDPIINNVERDFLVSHVSPLKITTPVQTAATDAPAFSSTKNVAPSTKSKKKSSPLRVTNFVKKIRSYSKQGYLTKKGSQGKTLSKEEVLN